ncbi:rRNA-processing protein fcf1-like protein [Plakobranchus ocellatus]|uniref:rRNA-processing protein FCF1 homolog n=1 Tax=Plakobranchus ocellatus TaxID=259542 RepID=A0AAV4C2V7_9GAST|nr:rRNA-processing protein fcf1-like protein [Plakobranchus ocellatus]
MILHWIVADADPSELQHLSKIPSSESDLSMQILDQDVDISEGRQHFSVEAWAKGKDKSTKKFAQVKRLLSLKDSRFPQASSAMYFKYNTQLGPPFHIIVDTNFINFSIKNKLDIVTSMMDCLYAKCIPYITDCVMAELEKLGRKYRVALKIAKDSRFHHLTCIHKGTYADDCIVKRVTESKCYIVATNDKDLKKRIRKIPGVPIMYVANHRYTIERLPDAYGAPKV